MEVIDLFSLSEQRARKDATVYFLKHINTINNSIEDLIDISSEHSLIYKMANCLKTIDINIQLELNNFELPIKCAYLYKKYNCGNNLNKLHISDDAIKKYKKGKFSSNDCYELSKEFYDYLHDNFTQFFIDLVDMIFVHIKNN